MNCSNCRTDLSAVEIIERKAKTGANAGSLYKARICPNCNQFNFINDKKQDLPKGELPNDLIERLDRIESKVEVIIRKMTGLETRKDKAWDEFEKTDLGTPDGQVNS